jgi:hypothetical protein
MPTLTLPVFGGLNPSALPRTLPNEGAQVAHNLFARTVEFRPVGNDLVAASASVSNPKTLYRTSRSPSGGLSLDSASGWRASSDVMHYVRGQVNDDATERTYYTFGGGTAPPRVFDLKGVDKKLGVPPPGSAPTVEVIVVDEVTPEEESNAPSIPESTAASFIDALTVSYVGVEDADMPPGYGKMSNYPGAFKNNLDTYAIRAFRIASQNATAVLDAQNGRPPEEYNWIFGLSGQRVQFEGSWWFCITFPAYGKRYTLDETKLRSSIEGTAIPGTTPPQYPTAEYVDAIMAEATKSYQTAVEGGLQREDDLMYALSVVGNEIDGPDRSPSAAKVAATRTAIAALKSVVDNYTNWWESWANEANAGAVVSDMINNNDYGFPTAVERIVDYRFYVYTYVTDWGEESAPSPVSELAELDQNDSTTVTLSPPPSGANITKWRLYRSNVGSQRAEFQFVKEDDASATTFADEVKSSALAEVCPTTTWAVPPEKLTGLVGLPNGIMAGFVDNYVAFCEPYHPYAWPVEYQITTEWPIVALGVYGQTVVVGTTGNPYLMSGSDSASMSAVKLDANQSCVAARSMVSVDGGVVFASPDGLCLANESGVRLVTLNYFTREDWQKLNPSSIIAGYHEMTYYFMVSGGAAGSKTYALHLETGKLTTLDVTGSTFYSDMLTDKLYVASGSNIIACFSGTGHRSGRFKSKRFVAPLHASYAWASIESNFEEGPVTLRWFGDGELKHTTSVSSRAPVRLPAGRWLEHEVEIESSSRVKQGDAGIVW